MKSMLLSILSTLVRIALMSILLKALTMFEDHSLAVKCQVYAKSIPSLVS